MNHGELSLPLARVEEGQPVDIVRRSVPDEGLRIVGMVKEKLLAKQELQQSKMAQVREASEAAERARHARRTLSLDDYTPTRKGPLLDEVLEADMSSLDGKRKVTRSPTPKARKPIIRRLVPPLIPSSTNHSSISDLESHDSWSTNDGSVIGREVTSSSVTMDSDKVKNFAPSRKSAVRQLISRLPSAALSRSPVPSTEIRDSSDQYHQLEEEFGKRYQEYLSLNDWMDKRLAVFAELRNQLSASTNQVPDQQLMFRLVVEEKRLKEDATYQEKLEQLEEACAALIMIKARLKEIVEQQCPKPDKAARAGQQAL